MTKYIAVRGINYLAKDGNGEVRVEPGGTVPAFVIKRSPWLLERGAVAAVEGSDSEQPIEEVIT